MGASLITLQEYKTYAGITNPNSDAEISLLIPAISDLVKSYCKRTFVDYVTTPKVEHFNGASSSLMLSETPVISVVSVEYSSDFGQSYRDLTEFVDWVEDDGYIVSVNPAGFPRQLRGYQVTYKAGYTQLPAELKLALLDLVTYYRRNDGAVHSPKAPGTNSVQIEYISTTTLPAHIRRILDLHREHYA